MIQPARKGEVSRKTKETDISLSLCLDGEGAVSADTGVGFFDHMLELLGRHGGFDLSIRCKGDIQVDAHHTVEDVGIALGKALAGALGDKAGIYRYGDCALPMDETLILCAVDISGRGMYFGDLRIPAEQLGNFETELAAEFMRAFAANAGITLHLRQLAGENSHHIIEGCFKALGHALRKAVAVDPAAKGRILSTKGVL